jgi:hypothetical protein
LPQQATSVLGCDFLTVNRLFLKRFYILLFSGLATGRVRLARKLLMECEDEHGRPRFLVRDRDSKFTREFEEVFHSDGIRVIEGAGAGAVKVRRTPSAGSAASAASASTGS